MIRPDRIVLALAAALAAALTPGPGPLAASAAQHDGHRHADHDHDDGPAKHGGTVAETERHRFEVVFEADGLRVYPLGERMSPEAVAGLEARAFFLLPGAKAYTDPYPLRPVASSAGRPAEALGLEADLSRVPTEGTRVTFQVWKLPDPAESKVEFTVPFTVIRAVEATAADRIGVVAQGTCPVSEQDLGAMGDPIKVTRGDDSLFLCCRGCLPKVEAAPDRYFDAVISASRATEADREAVAAQGTCPISERGLDAMGGPIEISRGDRSVFVCCAACIDAVKEDAERHLGPPLSTGGEEHDPSGHDHGG